MSTRKQLGFISVLLALFMMGLACDFTGTPTPTAIPPTLAPTLAPTQPPQPTSTTAAGKPSPTAGLPPTAVVPTNSPTNPTGGETLNSAQKQQLARATVRILGVKKVNGKLTPLYNGSGTIISKDGMILTNCHVADPTPMGYPKEDEPDMLVVDLVESEDKPPVSTYIAKVLASDPTLDLAVIKIDKKLDGSAINPASLNLPFVKMGNSDDVKFGDTVYVFGFPGIGGQTITFTTGSISGFDSVEGVGNRAWMKTDATIAGGNSGGLASNGRAEIIGVPSRMGTSSAQSLTDCRVIADTNGDGKIDSKDTCVPGGGFINGIRPVNWAKALIDASVNGIAYTSPYSKPKPSATATPPKTGGTVAFTLNNWSTAIDANNCPTNPVQAFPTGTTKIFAVFKFSNQVKGDAWAYRWLLDDREVSSKSDTWKNAESGNCFSFSLENGGKALPDGTYKLEIYSGAKSTLAGTATAKIGGTGKTTPSGQGVKVTGTVKDGNTGKGIANIYIIVLKSGIDPDDWLDNNGSDSDILTFTQTNANGEWTLPDLLQRGSSYGAIAGNNKLGYQSSTGYIEITKDDPDVIKINIELTK